MDRTDPVLGKKKTNMRVPQVLVAIAVLTGTLFLGIGIGNGSVAFGADSAYKKAVGNNGSGSLSYSGIDDVYQALKSEFDGQLDNQKLQEGMKEGLVKAAGDPYTEYFTAEEYKKFNEQIDGAFEGIGATLGLENDAVTVIAPIDGSPAEKAGLKSKDIIAKINGENALDLKLDEAVSKIRGPKGTVVKLEVIRAGKAVDISITRDVITIPSVKWEVNKDNVGILTINQFGSDTNELALQAATEFKQKNVKAVVLDMRGDPGGLLDSAVYVSSMWLPKGKLILQEKRENVVTKTYTATGKNPLLGIPTVVLLDGSSASASEITAGALRDNGVASIIGTKSYGKGSVQNIQRLADGSAIKVTIARWYTPNGRNIDKDGIEPDQKVEISDQDVEAKRDPQLDAALTKLNQ
jgi:carboxyl-terminal processing protease